MTSNPPIGTPSPPGPFFDGYAATDGVFDEFCTADGTRPHWQPFVELVDQLSRGELLRRWEQASRLIRGFDNLDSE